MHVDKDSKEAQRAAAKEAAKAAAPLVASAGGLDAVLSEFEKKKKVCTGLPLGNRYYVRLMSHGLSSVIRLRGPCNATEPRVRAATVRNHVFATANRCVADEPVREAAVAARARCLTQCLRRAVPRPQVTVLDKTRADWSEYKVRGRVRATSLGTGCCPHVVEVAGRHVQHAQRACAGIVLNGCQARRVTS